MLGDSIDNDGKLLSILLASDETHLYAVLATNLLLTQKSLEVSKSTSRCVAMRRSDQIDRLTDASVNLHIST